MSESRFIKSVTFGGYDKNDVDKRLEYLYTQIHDLKNALSETRSSLKKFRKGTEEEKVHEEVLQEERERLTEVQTKNDVLTEKLRVAEDDIQKKDAEIEKLRKNVEELTDALSDTQTTLSSLSSGDETALSIVFIEAKKSAGILVENAHKQAEDIKADAKKLAENVVTEANNTAKNIIYNAEREAAEINAKALDKQEEMNVASNNMKAIILNDVSVISGRISELKGIFEGFLESGISTVEKSQTLLSDAENELKNNGVPVFKDPAKNEPEYPDEPEYEDVDDEYFSNRPPENKERKEALNKLKAMADALEGNGGKAEKSSSEGGKVDLAALAQQAAALDEAKDEASEEKKDEAKADSSEKEKPKNSGIDLAALAKQADSL